MGLSSIMDSLIDTDLKCHRCKLRCSGSKNPSVVNTGGYNAPVDTTWSIRKSSSSIYWNKLSSISNNKNMLQEHFMLKWRNWKLEIFSQESVYRKLVSMQF